MNIKTIMYNGVNWYKAKDVTKELGFKTYVSKYVNPANQRFRDALTFCSHMKPLYRNLDEKHFVNL